MLADIVRTDRHYYRPYLGNSDLSESIKVLTRAHQDLIYQRQSHVNLMRATLRQYYPGLLLAFPGFSTPSERDRPDAMELLQRAPTPEHGRRLTYLQIAKILRAAGRQRCIERRAKEIYMALGAEQLEASSLLASAYGEMMRAHAAVVRMMTTQVRALEEQLSLSFEKHPDADILLSLPGLGKIMGARALGEFGDAPHRYANSKARKNYATTSPVTRASGKLRVVSARHGGNRRLLGTMLRWGFTAIQASPGARQYYEELRNRQKTHPLAMRAVANRMVGILHYCLEAHVRYDESLAWPNQQKKAA
jgi:hypothetical protein